MKINSIKLSVIGFISILFLCCTSDDVGTDTDGPTKQGFPEVTTRTVIASDEGTSVETGGEVKNSGGSDIIKRGVC